jgi:sentrin-specific protease 8
VAGNRILAGVRHPPPRSIGSRTNHPRYLEREDLKAYPKASIVLLRPSMSFMLMQTPNPLTLKEALPSFYGVTHVFLPINDNADVEQAEGGSHWSLLLVSIIDGVAFHYDSMSGNNEREARSTAMKMEHLLGRRLRFIPMLDSPQQENGSDCGVFVCVLIKHLLLKKLLRADASKKVSMSMKDAHINARDGRRQMLKVIEERKKEGERRRSYVQRCLL